MATLDRREQDRARRKQEILQAARLVFAQSGFRRATMEQVAERAELAKGTLYLYFENKEAILAELVLQALNELASQLQAANESRPLLQPDARLRAMAEAYLTFAQRSPDYFRLLTAFDGGDFEKGLSPERRDQIRTESNRTLELVHQAIADGVAMGMFQHPNPRQAANVLWAALNGVLALMSHPVRRQLVATDLSELYTATLELFLQGLMCPTFYQKE